ncbi:hypothetical protein, partial [Yersinia pestis]|uniref:hypothetical protein n=2 Tax=Yersinia pestis TaxID=632 RepID=UPI00050CEEB8
KEIYPYQYIEILKSQLFQTDRKLQHNFGLFASLDPLYLATQPLFYDCIFFQHLVLLYKGLSLSREWGVFYQMGR